MNNTYLIINPYGIGDVMFSTPLLENIKHHDPQAKILYLCNRRTQDILEHHPCVDHVCVYEKDEFVAEKRRSFFGWLKKWMALLNDIRDQKCCVAIDLSLSTKIGIIPVLAGIKKRVGLNYKHRGRFLTQSTTIDGFSGMHAADHYAMVLDLINIPRQSFGITMGLSQQAKEWAEHFFHEHVIQPTDYVVTLAPCGGETWGSRAEVKRWPKENFSELINRLLSEYRCKILLFSGPKEESELTEIVKAVDDASRCFLITQTTLMQSAALIERCHLLIGNDTGILRFADAFQKKIIAFFGPTDDAVYGMYPYDQTRHAVMFRDVDCRPCYRKFKLNDCTRDQVCLRDVGVSEVMDQVGRLLPKKG